MLYWLVGAALVGASLVGASLVGWCCSGWCLLVGAAQQRPLDWLERALADILDRKIVADMIDDDCG